MTPGLKEEWLAPGGVVPVDASTTAILLAEVMRLSRIATADKIIAELRARQERMRITMVEVAEELTRSRKENAEMREHHETTAAQFHRALHLIDDLNAERDAIRAKTIGEALDAVYWFHNVGRYTLADVASRIRAILGEPETP